MTSTDSNTRTSTTAAPRLLTQTDQVLDYLRNTGPLDQFTAKDELGVLRLGARIWDLKQRGYAIRTELIEAPTEYGGTRIARYALLRERARDGRDIEEDAARATASGPGPAPRFEVVPDGVSPPSEPRTLDEALWTFGDRAASLGVSPTVREFQAALGAASESVAHRWLRVLEREGYLALNERLGLGGGTASGRGAAARSWQVTPPGYERLYVLERAHRVELEADVCRLEARRDAGRKLSRTA